jgi:ATP adenylyltransferase
MTKKVCPFCEIDLGKTEVIEESELCFVALSNPRLIVGHLLVIPKRHVERPWELSAKEAAALYEVVIRYQKKIVDLGIATGCDVRQNYRPFIPQGKIKVDHMYFHLLPREPEDEYFEKVQIGERDLWRDLSQTERQKLKKVFS